MSLKVPSAFIVGLSAVSALVLGPAQARADILFSYNGFTSTSALTTVGNSATANTSDGTVLRVTPAISGQTGAVYRTTAVPLGSGNTFSTQFQFRFTGQGGIAPADGITFLLTTNTTGLGQSGVGLGYQGTSGKSVAIEFDTFNNAGFGIGNNDGNSSNHVSIDTNGNLDNTGVVNVYGIANCDFSAGYTQAGCMSNGHLWTVTISYDGAHLTVVLTDPAEGTTFTALNNYAINLASILGQNTAFVGFSSGTGAGFENHDILNWTFSNSATLTPTPSVPTLTGWSLAGLASLLAIAGGLSLRRRDSLGRV